MSPVRGSEMRPRLPARDPETVYRGDRGVPSFFGFLDFFLYQKQHQKIKIFAFGVQPF